MTYDDLKLDDGRSCVCSPVRGSTARWRWCMPRTPTASRGSPSARIGRPVAPKYHATRAPMAIEREATHRAITLSELVDVPILIVHVSGREAIEQIRWAHAHGLRIYAETCPQYLFLTPTISTTAIEGAKCVCSPPPRDKANQRVVWDGLADGLFTIFSSDHAPFRFDDPQGKKPAARKSRFRTSRTDSRARNTPAAALFRGVRSGRITLNQFVALTATNPAEAVRPEPAQGHDRDRLRRRHRDLGSGQAGHDREPIAAPRCRLHAYEGMVVTGWPVTTLVRGRRVWERGEFRGEAGFGRFLACGKPDMARPKVVDPWLGRLCGEPARRPGQAGAATRWLISPASTRRDRRGLRGRIARSGGRGPRLSEAHRRPQPDAQRGRRRDTARARQRHRHAAPAHRARRELAAGRRAGRGQGHHLGPRSARDQGSLLFSDFVAREDALAVGACARPAPW
jgi:dihydropyrimidinase